MNINGRFHTVGCHYSFHTRRSYCRCSKRRRSPFHGKRKEHRDTHKNFNFISSDVSFLSSAEGLVIDSSSNLLEQGFGGTRLMKMKLGRWMPCGEWNEVTKLFRNQKDDISATRRAADPTEGRALLAMIILVILATLS